MLTTSLGRTQWRIVEGNVYQIHHPGFAVYGTIHTDPACGFSASFRWSARVMSDCRDKGPASGPIAGRAHTLNEAKRIVETLLVNTRTISAEQVPHD